MTVDFTLKLTKPLEQWLNKFFPEYGYYFCTEDQFTIVIGKLTNKMPKERREIKFDEGRLNIIPSHKITLTEDLQITDSEIDGRNSPKDIIDKVKELFLDCITNPITGEVPSSPTIIDEWYL